ncbi:unnamed protein product [Closterium sp. NIES-53]
MALMQPSLGPSRDEPKVFGLDKFNGDNFTEWSFKMENIFDHYDLLEVMEGTEKRSESDPEKSPWVRKSAQGYLLLGQALESNQIRHIKPFQREPEKGPKAWTALKGVHASATAAVAVVLERQMAALRIEEDEAVEEGSHGPGSSSTSIVTCPAFRLTPSIADLSLFLRTDTSLPPFYVLVARRTITLTESDLVHQDLQCFGFQFSSRKPTPLSTDHSLSALPSDESVEPSGPYPELVGCLMYLMTCTRPDLAYPLSLLARYVAPGRHRKELRWLTYLLTHLGEQPRSPPVLYVDNKAMIALCQEHRLEHRTKHIALQYFLARELQQRGQLHLAYVTTRANNADIFTKALQSCDLQRFSTVLGLVLTLPHLLTA